MDQREIISTTMGETVTPFRPSRVESPWLRSIDDNGQIEDDSHYSESWKNLMPYDWSCPQNNHACVILDREGNLICQKMARRIALIVANKPIPISELRRRRHGDKRILPNCGTPPQPAVQQRRKSHSHVNPRINEQINPLRRSTQSGGHTVRCNSSEMNNRSWHNGDHDSKLYPYLKGSLNNPSLNDKVNIELGRDIKTRDVLQPGEAPAASLEIAEVFYFEISLSSGNAWIGLVSAESEQAQLIGSQSVASVPHPFEVRLGQLPGYSSNSIGLGWDGQLLLSGSIISTDEKCVNASFSKNSRPWAGRGFKQNDTIGCAWEIGGLGRVFFSCNGELINPHRPICFKADGKVMFPAVGVDSEYCVISGNFGLSPFKWKGSPSLKVLNPKISQDDSSEEVVLHTSKSLSNPVTKNVVVNHDSKIGDTGVKIVNFRTNHEEDNLNDIRGNIHEEKIIDEFGPTPADHDQDNIIDYRGIKEQKKADSTEIKAVKKIIEDGKEILGELRTINAESNPAVVESIVEYSQSHHAQVKSSIEISADLGAMDVMLILLELNDSFNDILETVQKSFPLLFSSKETASDDKKELFAVDSNRTADEVATLVEKKDVFGLVCILRKNSGGRLESAKSIMRLAKDADELAADGVIKIRNEIRSCGGLLSLLTIFSSCDDGSALKLIAAFTVVNLVSDTSNCRGSLGIKILQCIRYLVECNEIPADVGICRREVREVAALALGHLWINVVQPMWSESNVGKLGFLDESDKFVLTKRKTRVVGGHWRRLEQRQDILEVQVMLETTISLVVIVANSEIDDRESCDNGNKTESKQDLGFNLAVTVETLCAIDSARPIAVREGILKVLVRWLDSGNVELVRPAANALRDLAHSHDEYMRGWIHSQIVNEDALSSIVKLAVFDQLEVRLSVAHILSSLSVAPHTRAAIVDAKGLSYLVQLLVDAMNDVPNSKMQEPLALVAGSAIFQLAVGALIHTKDWLHPSAAPEVNNNVVNCIVQGGALGPLIAIARSKDRGKLRLMSVEILRIITEDIKPGYTRLELCDAGVAMAFGNVLNQNTSTIYTMLKQQNSNTQEGEVNQCGPSPKNDMASSLEILAELNHALNALINMLSVSTREEEGLVSLIFDENETPSATQEALLKMCMQTAESGGLESLLSMASLPTCSQKFLQESLDYAIDSGVFLTESCRCLASLCPLLISQGTARKGFAKWAGEVLLSLAGILKREVKAEQEEEVLVVRELQLDALRGLCSLAFYEPLKVRIVDECLPQLLKIKNYRDNLKELAQFAIQVLQVLGFSVEDMKLAGNDSKLLSDWFCLERSLLIQAMAKDELLRQLYLTWRPALSLLCDSESILSSNTFYVQPGIPPKCIKALPKEDSLYYEEEIPAGPKNKNAVSGGHKNHANSTSDSLEKEHDDLLTNSSLTDMEDVHKHKFLSQLFENLVHGIGSSDMRSSMLEQYSYVYESNTPSSNDNANQSFSNEFAVGKLSYENVDDIDMDENKTSSTKTHDDPHRDHVGLLASHPYPMRGVFSEAEWILSHRRTMINEKKSKFAMTENSIHFPAQLPLRIKNLLNFYFPSSMIQSEVLPFYNFCPEASFDFNALAMPERRYFSFRREGQILSRICEKYAAELDSEDAFWTLGFANSSFAGEFGETLVQALYRCPNIQALSFSKSHHHRNGNYVNNEDDGSTHLAYFAGSLPPWIKFLTFDNVLNKQSMNEFVDILTSLRQRTGRGKQQEDFRPDFPLNEMQLREGQHEGCAQGSFIALAITNSPQLSGATIESFINLLGSTVTPQLHNLERPPLHLLRVLDLSGNKLGDATCAKVLAIVHTKSHCSSLERLDLSGNDIRAGIHVVEIMRDYIRSHRHSIGISKTGHEWCSTLIELNLTGNRLCDGKVVVEILSMLKNDALGLHSLNLADNGLTGEQNSFLQILDHSLRNNTKLIELDLSGNRIKPIAINKIVQGLKDTKSTWSSLAFFHLHGNIPSLSEDQTKDLNECLNNARAERVKRYFVEKNGVAVQEKEDVSSGAEENSAYIPGAEFTESAISEKKHAETKSSSDPDYTTHPPKLNQRLPSAGGDLLFNNRNSIGKGTFDRSVSDSQMLSKIPKNKLQPNPKPSLVPIGERKRRTSSEENKITFLFSAPLAWYDSNTNVYCPIDKLDFESERDLLWHCFKEASMDIELSFDNATVDRLQATITKQCKCLHYSGHGIDQNLVFEDGKGGLHFLPVERLTDLMSNGGKGGAPFKFVFVSACYSGTVGETFVSAGVPHVVCCQQGSELMDCAALAFTRAFYLALAIGRTVKDSFEIGRQAVAVAPSVPNSGEEMEKFILLPEGGNHDEPIFDAERISEWPRKSGSTPSLLSSQSSRRSLKNSRKDNSHQEQSLPTPPQGFLGREVEMYHVLSGILSRRFVSLVGITGIGRSSLASALCHYINERKSSIISTETIFFVRSQPARGSDRGRFYITQLHKMLASSGMTSPVQKGADLDDFIHGILHGLNKTKALIVFDRVEVVEGTIDADEFPLFLGTLFRETKYTRVLMTGNKPLGFSSLCGVGEHIFKLGPLNFKSTVKLFGILCPLMHTGDERRRLQDHLVEEQEGHFCSSDNLVSQRVKDIFGILGDGIPSKTFDIAYRISKEDFGGLIKLGHADSDCSESLFFSMI